MVLIECELITIMEGKGAACEHNVDYRSVIVVLIATEILARHCANIR